MFLATVLPSSSFAPFPPSRGTGSIAQEKATLSLVASRGSEVASVMGPGNRPGATGYRRYEDGPYRPVPPDARAGGGRHRAARSCGKHSDKLPSKEDSPSRLPLRGG